MADFYEYVKDILIVAIPSVIGAFTSKGIINSWQTNTEKFKLRKQILTDYQNSYIRAYTTMGNFASSIYWHYVESAQWDTSEERKKVKEKVSDKELSSHIVVVFPDDKTEQPFAKFAKEYAQYRIVMQEDHRATWDFYATLQLYHDDENLEIELEQLSKLRTL